MKAAQRCLFLGLIVIMIASLLPGGRFSGGRAAAQSAPEYAPGVILVGIKAIGQAASLQSTDRVTANFIASGAVQVEPLFSAGARPAAVSSSMTDIGLGLEQIYRVTFPPEQDALVLAEAFAQRADVLFAEPDYYAYPLLTPDDPLAGEQWGLRAVEAQTGWDISTGSGAVVAVLDSGIDWSHEDLAGQAWQNPGEVAGNGLDDDHNGYIDDIHGVALYGAYDDLNDASGHGTQVAGVLAAKGNNGKGIAGMCWDCQLMTVKVLRPDGTANYSDIAAGVLYAAQKGARVINISLGGTSDSAALRSAIATAAETALIVAGAGNENREQPFYPAAYPETLAAAGINPDGTKTIDSNYGSWVDLAAPGANIQTLFSGGGYGSASGTSVAAPWVSGAAALIASQHPDWDPREVRAQLLNTTASVDTQNPTLAGKLGSGKLLAGPALATAPQPRFSLAEYTAAGQAGGSLPVGASSTLVLTLRNEWASAGAVTLTLTTTSPDAVIEAGQASLGSVPSGAEASNLSTPFQIKVGADKYGLVVPFTLTVNADGVPFQINFTVNSEPQAVEKQGKLTTDQIWTADRVYKVVGNLIIPTGVTLTIEPGTLVKVATDKTILVNGTLIAEGTSDKKITFTAVDPSTASRWGGFQFTNCASASFDEANTYQTGSVLGYNVVEWTKHILTATSCAPYLHHNLLRQNTGGVFSNMVTELIRFEWNELTQNASPAVLVSLHGKITHNLFHENKGSLIVFEAGRELRWNTLINNLPEDMGSTRLVTVSGWDAASLLTNNNLIADEGTYAVYGMTAMQVDATNNYWGTTSESAISDRIYDIVDSLSAGEVIFTPYLLTPEPSAPVFLSSAELTPNSPVGIQTIEFKLRFSGPPQTSSDPVFVFASSKRGSIQEFPEVNLFTSKIAVDPAGRVYAVCADNEERCSVWRYDGTAWAKMTSQNSGLPDSKVTAIHSDTAGNVWFGHRSGQVSRLSASGVWTVQQAGSTFVKMLTTTPDGRAVAVFAFGGGISIQSGSAWQQIPAVTGLDTQEFEMVAVDGTGAVWAFAGPPNYKLARYNGSSWTVFGPGSGMPEGHPIMWAMMRDTQGRLWASFSDMQSGAQYPYSVGVYEQGAWKYFSVSQVAGASWINNFAEDAQGRIYAGYSAGILRYDGEKWAEIFNRPTQVVYGPSFAIDRNGSIWLTENLKVTAIWGGKDFSGFYDGQWVDDQTYSAKYDINMLIPQDQYRLSISGITGPGGMSVPSAGPTFTVAYAGQVTNASVPAAPVVFATGLPGSPTRVDAEWSGETGFVYRYSIGTGPNLADVLGWTESGANKVSLNLPALTVGKHYWVSVRARNPAGLWSPVGSFEFVSGEQSYRKVYLPGALR